MFFKQEKLNPDNKNYLVKTIGPKLYYVIYSSTSLFIANLICLAIIPTPDLIIYHLEQNLTASCIRFVHCSYQKKTTHAMYYRRGGLQQRNMENKSAYYCNYRGLHTVVITQVVPLCSCNLFLFILVTRMKQLDYCKIAEEKFNFVAHDTLKRILLKISNGFP